MQENQRGITVVVDSCFGNVTNTYEINGKDASFVGSGDLHTRKYSARQYSEFFYGFVDESALRGLLYCKHKISVYPTRTYVESFESSDPMIYTLLIGGFGVLALLLFSLYDSIFRRQQSVVGIFRRQQSVVVGEAERSNVVAASLLPGKISRRLFLDSSTGDGRSVRSEGNRSTTSVNLHNFMNKGDLKISEARSPIAELFPVCTIMFSDISGFTAWSSIREPSQVFMLLESIFQAFDAIAKSFGVFKVETVGDSYMACCGVPEPNEDHATVMAQFARECLRKFQTVVQDLELKLGPDTGDLAMRYVIALFSYLVLIRCDHHVW